MAAEQKWLNNKLVEYVNQLLTEIKDLKATLDGAVINDDPSTCQLCKWGSKTCALHARVSFVSNELRRASEEGRNETYNELQEANKKIAELAAKNQTLENLIEIERTKALIADAQVDAIQKQLPISVKKAINSASEDYVAMQKRFLEQNEILSRFARRLGLDVAPEEVLTPRFVSRIEDSIRKLLD